MLQRGTNISTSEIITKWSVFPGLVTYVSSHHTSIRAEEPERTPRERATAQKQQQRATVSSQESKETEKDGPELDAHCSISGAGEQFLDYAELN